MQVLVTGGAGFIGSHLIKRLLELGHAVDCLDNFDDYYDPSIKRANIAPMSGSDDFQLFEGDICNGPFVEAVLQRRHRVVVHLAARAGVRPSIEEPARYINVNIQGTLNLLEACRQAGVEHFVFGSSSSVYGATKVIPFREDLGQLVPVSPYAFSKLAGEQLCSVYHQLYALPVSCLRFFTVYGPRQRPDMAISRFTQCIEDGKPVPIFGDGTSRRDYTHVDDIVDGIIRTLERPDGFQVYNLASATAVMLSDLVATIAHAVGRSATISYQPLQRGDVPITYGDIERAQHKLGYRPQVSLKAGIARFVAWFRATRAPGTGAEHESAPDFPPEASPRAPWQDRQVHNWAKRTRLQPEDR